MSKTELKNIATQLCRESEYLEKDARQKTIVDDFVEENITLFEKMFPNLAETEETFSKFYKWNLKCRKDKAKLIDTLRRKTWKLYYE